MSLNDSKKNRSVNIFDLTNFNVSQTRYTNHFFTSIQYLIKMSIRVSYKLFRNPYEFGKYLHWHRIHRRRILCTRSFHSCSRIVDV